MSLTKATYSMIDGAVVNVLDFGADPTGVADSTTAIQAAIDSFNPYLVQYSVFSGTVFLPKGTYKVSTIELRNGVVLQGDGRGTGLKTTANAPVIRQAVNTVANGSQVNSAYGICDLNIVGSNTLCNGSLSLQDAIYLGYADPFNSASYSFIQNVHIFFMGGSGIKLRKPTVTNPNFGWTQFGQWQDIVIQGCEGYGVIANGVSSTGADFSSMVVSNLVVNGCFSGGVALDGGNDNSLRMLSSNIGTCTTPSGTFTNTSCAPNVVLDNQLSTDVWVHVENNANPTNNSGLFIGASTICYTTTVSGLFYGFKTPIRLDNVNSVNLNNLIFLSGTIGEYCITTTSSSRYVDIGKNWYVDINGVLFLSDGNSGGFAATGFTQLNTLGFGPTNTQFSGLLSNNLSPIGYATGSGQSVTQLTDKTTSVTCNRVTGQITTANDSLGAGATALFAVNNNNVVVGDTVILNLSSGAASYTAYTIRVVRVAAGFFLVAIKNDTGGALSEALVLNFTVLKGAIS
jgi:hypothetical protein